MKKYLLTTLLILALVMTLTACGKNEKNSENGEVSTNAQVQENTANESDMQTDSDATSSNDNTKDVTANTYEGIDFDSTLPGREWIQTTFPSVIDEPKIVIFNNETNRKTIVENGELVVYNDGDTFAMYMPEGTIITESSYLVNESIGYGCCKELTFDKEVLKEEYLLWKNIDGGALYKVIVNNNGTEQEFSCIISLGE